jgi:simple sugar transport system permease protein
MVLASALYCYFQYTHTGLNARAVGENPAADDASGIPVALYKYLHICGGGFLCGLGRAYLSLVFVPRWQENITAGAGWIAVALIIFSTWNPLKAVFAAYIFGALKGLGFKFQNINLAILDKKDRLLPSAARHDLLHRHYSCTDPHRSAEKEGVPSACRHGQPLF